MAIEVLLPKSSLLPYGLVIIVLTMCSFVSFDWEDELCIATCRGSLLKTMYVFRQFEHLLMNRVSVNSTRLHTN